MWGLNVLRGTLLKDLYIQPDENPEAPGDSLASNSHTHQVQKFCTAPAVLLMLHKADLSNGTLDPDVLPTESRAAGSNRQDPALCVCRNSPHKATCWYRWHWRPIPASPKMKQHLVMLKLYCQTLACCTAAFLSRPLWTRGPSVTNCLLGVHRTGTAQTFGDWRYSSYRSYSQGKEVWSKLHFAADRWVTSMLFWAIWTQSCKNSMELTETNTKYCHSRGRATHKTPVRCCKAPL